MSTDAQLHIDATIKVLVVYDSAYGHTKDVALHVVDGAKNLQELGSVKVTVDAVAVVVEEVTAEVLFSSDALVVGSPVYWSNMSGKIKTFFDDWQLKFGVWPDLKMRDKIGAAFACHGHEGGGAELTTMSILGCMLNNGMIVLSGDNSFGITCLTEGHNSGVTEAVRARALALGSRVAKVALEVRLGRQATTAPK